ncbi:glycoside hydrolase family 127 protein [uncultured Draconibacterium sp.]|uniref:aceric acid hydrolase n=1 Tax=uncultured Draconibacterium sp. TaxID=1573823 RepID=UPI0025DD68BB|nr:glycoside hydrolase family 127 protein [uncultured Draconibacterium sp.]
MKLQVITLSAFLLLCTTLWAQEKALTNTTNSSFAKLKSTNIGDVHWTNGFWAERFEVCKNSMVPHMMGCYLDDEISHAFKNFEIAAGLDTGSHVGPPFHDGDFYKILEAEIMVYALTKDEKLGKQINEIITMIGKAQREDGYIHTPTSIKEMKNPEVKHEFNERLDFETYNMGHLMTAACIHFRTTGQTTLLNIAQKATDYLYNFYKRASAELARNAICPSHYMGVVEMYRTTQKPEYLELAKSLIEIRSLVENGTDHNQDRIPFKQQTKAIGHAVRANYLYAGVADVYAETGDDSLMIALKYIWNDLVERKMYITGACGALYDGVSPNGTTYDQPSIQQVHQAYGADYELPNISAHNESCANIGNLLWNWRMLQVTGDANYADVMETVMYNSLLAGVSLDGKGYFYTNPLSVANELSHDLRWSKNREPYISYCNCCPPNTVRTVAQIQEYAYSLGENAVWVNFYGSNKLESGNTVQLTQESDFPWDGNIKITIDKLPKNFALHLRIPGWASLAKLKVNGQDVDKKIQPGTYVEISQEWEKGDVVELDLPMKAVLIEANPLVEETRNQVAVKRGPVVYCLESPDIEDGKRIFDYKIPAEITFETRETKIANATMIVLEGELITSSPAEWENTLYRAVAKEKLQKTKIKLIPYYAWNNRGPSEMSVWIPFAQ